MVSINKKALNQVDFVAADPVYVSYTEMYDKWWQIGPWVLSYCYG